MEIPEMILTQALAKHYSSSIHLELNSVLKKLESKKLEDFLNGERKEEMRTIDNEIRYIITTNVYNNQKSESEKVEVIAQIIFTITEYLRKGLSGGDVRAILIFLGVNCYLQIEIERLLSKKELEDVKPEERPIRQIIIETNGDWVNLVKAQVAGDIELIGILQRLITAVSDKMAGK